MARSFISLINQAARDQARRQREEEKRLRARKKEYERAQHQATVRKSQLERESVRLQTQNAKQTAAQKAQAEKEAKQQYLDSRIEEVDDNNKDLAEKLTELKGVLEYTIHVNDAISFDDLRAHDKFPELVLPDELQKTMAVPDLDQYLNSVAKPGSLEKLIPGWEGRYQKAIQDAKKRFEDNKAKYDKFTGERDSRIKILQHMYEKDKQIFDSQIGARNQGVDELERAYRSNDPDAVCAYNTMVLERSEYPDGFPQEFRVAYVPEPKEIVIEYELPSIDIVPTIAEYRYVKVKDVIEEKPAKPADTKELYQDIVASICLRTIHEVLEADQGNNILVVAFNGFVQTVDPSTGKDIRPCLISIRTTKEKFSEINIGRIDKRACLRNLGAQVSQRPEEMQPVKPIVDFNMVDRRFVEQSDIIGDLESRPNLMELKPFEFENLVGNLFGQIGFESKLTRSSKDGGVDVIAFDPRPILGGKIVIQAKRYKGVVGVSAVRDLYGTMINEGASKGILVATSHYGPDAYEFSKDKPIELVDGGGLLYLLQQQGVNARIIFPDDSNKY